MKWGAGDLLQLGHAATHGDLICINTFSRQRGVHAIEGVELPDLAALATMLRQTLTEIARDEGCNESDTFTALAVNADRKPVMSATLTLVVSTPQLSEHP